MRSDEAAVEVLETAESIGVAAESDGSVLGLLETDDRVEPGLPEHSVADTLALDVPLPPEGTMAAEESLDPEIPLSAAVATGPATAPDNLAASPPRSVVSDFQSMFRDLLPIATENRMGPARVVAAAAGERADKQQGKKKKR
ncbi:MAG: hypothetical protein HQL80_01540 [Magnetococcales bacterium]|nr:hypothetical protein [Magnetococcales bacterium]